nr:MULTISPECIES: hypothetical protein [unclassified Phenylobacterium]
MRRPNKKNISGTKGLVARTLSTRREVCSVEILSEGLRIADGVAAAAIRVANPVTAIFKEECWDYLNRNSIECDHYHLAIGPKAGPCEGLGKHALNFLQQLGLPIAISLLKPDVNLVGQHEDQVDVT